MHVDPVQMGEGDTQMEAMKMASPAPRRQAQQTQAAPVQQPQQDEPEPTPDVETEQRPPVIFRRATYPGQLTVEQLRRVLTQNRHRAEQSRADFLAKNPDYKVCSVSGCSGLVAPAYQQVLPDGTPWNRCPRTRVHAALHPTLFGQPRSR